MKRIVLASVLTSTLISSALAADLPARKAPPYVPVVAPFSWTGFYGGLNLGYGFGANAADYGQQLSYLNVPGQTFAIGGPAWTNQSNLNGIVGGGQFGYNFQVSQAFVAGLEADLQGSGLRSSSFLNAPASVTIWGSPPIIQFPELGTSQTRQSVDWYSTIRGRLGTTFFSQTTLFYLTGGLAFGGVHQNFGYNGFFTPFAPGGFSGAFAGGVTATSSTKLGWTAGAGVEWAPSSFPNWSVKLEYLYTDLGSTTTTVLGVGSAANGTTGRYIAALDTTHARWNTVRVGVNYHFWSAPPAPVVAKY